MRPIPLPKPVRDIGVSRGFTPQVIGGPDGDLTGDIRPVEALICIAHAPGAESDEEGLPNFSVLVKIDPDELEHLNKNGGQFWLSFVGHIVPFSMDVYESGKGPTTFLDPEDN